MARKVDIGGMEIFGAALTHGLVTFGRFGNGVCLLVSNEKRLGQIAQSFSKRCYRQSASYANVSS